jgi:hypothetical protein
MSAPADKSSKKSDKPKRPPSPPRRKNRFNEREVARAGRAAKAVGAERVEVDPETGKISIILPTSKGSAPLDRTDTGAA